MRIEVKGYLNFYTDLLLYLSILVLLTRQIRKNNHLILEVYLNFFVLIFVSIFSCLPQSELKAKNHEKAVNYIPTNFC